jgi:hypothetical protein
MTKPTGVFLFFSVVICALLLGTLLRRLLVPASVKPNPQVFFNNNLVATTSRPMPELRAYVVAHHLPLFVHRWADGENCVRIGYAFDNKNYRNGCGSTVDEAAQHILNDLHNGKPAPFDAEGIEIYNDPPREK